MGYLVDDGKYEYYKDENNEWKGKMISKGLSFTTSFRKGLKFHKAGCSFKCIRCKEEKPKYTRYLGKEYDKVCFECASEWIKDSFKFFEEGISILKDNENNLLKNEDKWKREMILGAIS